MHCNVLKARKRKISVPPKLKHLIWKIDFGSMVFTSGKNQRKIKCDNTCQNIEFWSGGIYHKILFYLSVTFSLNMNVLFGYNNFWQLPNESYKIWDLYFGKYCFAPERRNSIIVFHRHCGFYGKMGAKLFWEIRFLVSVMDFKLHNSGLDWFGFGSIIETQDNPST